MVVETRTTYNNEVKEDQDLADLLIDSDEPSLSSSDTSSTGDNVLDSLQNSISSPLISLMKSEFGGLFYNVKDTISINNILTNDQVKLLTPPTLKFLWAVKPFETENVDLENEDEVLQLFAIKISRGGRAPLTGEVITDARQDLDQGSRPSI